MSEISYLNKAQHYICPGGCKPIYGPEIYLKAKKRILRYVKGTKDLRLLHQKTHIFELIGYVDSDWCGDIHDRKNISRYAFFMGGCLHIVDEEEVHCHTINL
jgi:hypothetical protein